MHSDSDGQALPTTDELRAESASMRISLDRAQPCVLFAHVDG